MINPDEFKKIRAYCYSKNINFMPDSQEVKGDGTPFLVLHDKLLDTWYPTCESVQQVREVCKEIARQRAIKQSFSNNKKRISELPPAT